MLTPAPPFDETSALQKVRHAEDSWNMRDPHLVSTYVTPDSEWRACTDYIVGRRDIQAYLGRKWNRKLSYRIVKELWAYRTFRITIGFVYEYHDESGEWFRGYGNANWEFDGQGLLRYNASSANERPIMTSERKFHWPLGGRPEGYPGLDHFSL